VSDLADAHVLSLEYLESGGDSNVFNLGNGNGYSVKEVIDMARQITQKKINSVEVERRPGDPDILVGSSEKAKKVLGWEPKHFKLKTIIESAWNWHKANI